MFFSKKSENKEIIKSFNWENDKDIMKQTFINILMEKPINYLVISFYEYYLQYMVFAEPKEVYAECVSNEFLKGTKSLNDSQKNILKKRFNEPYQNDKYGNVSKNYHKYYLLENDDYEKIYEEFIYVFSNIFNVNNRSKIFFRFQYV